MKGLLQLSWQGLESFDVKRLELSINKPLPYSNSFQMKVGESFGGWFHKKEQVFLKILTGKCRVYYLDEEDADKMVCQIDIGEKSAFILGLYPHTWYFVENINNEEVEMLFLSTSLRPESDLTMASYRLREGDRKTFEASQKEWFK